MIEKEFVEEYNRKAKDVKAFGMPVESLTREELIAVLVSSLESHETTNRQLKKLLKMVSALGNK